MAAWLSKKITREAPLKPLPRFSYSSLKHRAPFVHGNFKFGVPVYVFLIKCREFIFPIIAIGDFQLELPNQISLVMESEISHISNPGIFQRIHALSFFV